MVYIIGIAFGALVGAAIGALKNRQMIFDLGSWIPMYLVLGSLWGFSAAALYKGDMKNREKGMLLTETKAYKKKHEQKKKKAEKQDQEV